MHSQFQSPLKFVVKHHSGRARCAQLDLPHGQVSTPVFMPVGTYGSVKGLTVAHLEALGIRLILGNTYHLSHRPGSILWENFRGLHDFMGWSGNILTDSGGYQMVSLLKLAHFSEEGVLFRYPHDPSVELLMSPEHCMFLQNGIGSDIIMALDDVVHSCVTGPRVEEAMERSIRWLDRCIHAHKRPQDQALFGIIQGGLDFQLRACCLKEMIQRDTPGYAIGGLSGGEAKDSFWRVVEQCTATEGGLPWKKPRYCMGVGYPIDIVVCVALGVDMFDCVYPTRTARFGCALTTTGEANASTGSAINLKKTRWASDMRTLNPDPHLYQGSICPCMACSRNISRAAIHSMLRDTSQDDSATPLLLLSHHNLATLSCLMRLLRSAMAEGVFVETVSSLVLRLFGNCFSEIPTWVLEALRTAGIPVVESPNTTVLEGETNTM